MLLYFFYICGKNISVYDCFINLEIFREKICRPRIRKYNEVKLVSQIGLQYHIFLRRYIFFFIKTLDRWYINWISVVQIFLSLKYIKGIDRFIQMEPSPEARVLKTDRTLNLFSRRVPRPFSAKWFFPLYTALCSTRISVIEFPYLVIVRRR